MRTSGKTALRRRCRPFLYVLCFGPISAIMFAQKAASQTAMARDAQVTPACGAEADGRVYVALGAEVFSFRDYTPVPAIQVPRPILFEVPSGKPVYRQVAAGARLLRAPEQAAPEGCRGNPAQRQTITIDPAQAFGLAPLAASTTRQENPVTLTVRRWGDLDELVHSSLFSIISPEQIQRMKQEALYHERQTSFCRSAEGQNLMHHTVFACFYRPMGHPDHGWSGDYAPPRIDLGSKFRETVVQLHREHGRRAPDGMHGFLHAQA